MPRALPGRAFVLQTPWPRVPYKTRGAVRRGKSLAVLFPGPSFHSSGKEWQSFGGGQSVKGGGDSEHQGKGKGDF